MNDEKNRARRQRDDEARTVLRFMAAKIREAYRPTKNIKKLPGEYSLSQIADDLGVVKPDVDKVLREFGGSKPTFERQFAAKFCGGSIDRLYAEALAWDAANPEKHAPEDLSARILRIGAHLNRSATEVLAVKDMVLAAYKGETPTDEDIAKLFDIPRQAKSTARPATDPGTGGGFAGKLPQREKPPPSDDEDEEPPTKINPRRKR